MRPTDYPYLHDRTLDLWLEFRQSGAVPDHQRGTAIDPLVYDSWVRCQDYFNLDDTHVAAPHLPLQQQGGVFVSAALPYLEDIYEYFADDVCLILLTDSSGIVVALEGDVRTQRRLGIRVGTQCGEAYMGTNALSLSLFSAMPTQVVGAEHYLRIFHSYGESAAPIHDQTGAIVGVIGLLTYADRIDQAHLALVMATARAISTQLQAEVILEQSNLQLRQLNQILRSVADGVITWNNAGIVDHVNDLACQMLGVNAAAMLGKPIADALTFSDPIASAITSQRELFDVETTIQIVDRFVRTVVTVRVLRDTNHEVLGGIAVVRTLSQVRSLVNQHTRALSHMTLNDIQFSSPPMLHIRRQAGAAAKGSLPVLISGEGGVGKTALAQAIHNAGPRASKPMVVVNCSVIPGEFMTEELSGREAHGSEPGRPSKFELADGGTLLFDQIHQLSLQGQEILLQVMNSRTVTRLYAQRTLTVNVRIIATTDRNIETLVATHSFLPQLYYQFNVFHLHLPPLRERREDIIRLTRHVLERTGEYLLDPEVIPLLENYPWPGNVRELESVLERASMHTFDKTIRVHDLPETVRNGHSLAPDAALPQPVLSLDAAEREAIMRAGWAHHGVLSDMAHSLGINRSTLWRKLKQHRIDADAFKRPH